MVAFGIQVIINDKLVIVCCGVSDISLRIEIRTYFWSRRSSFAVELMLHVPIDFLMFLTAVENLSAKAAALKSRGLTDDTLLFDFTPMDIPIFWLLLVNYWVRIQSIWRRKISSLWTLRVSGCSYLNIVRLTSPQSHVGTVTTIQNVMVLGLVSVPLILLFLLLWAFVIMCLLPFVRSVAALAELALSVPQWIVFVTESHIIALKVSAPHF